MIIRDDLWLCEDCMQAAINGESPPDATPEEDAKIEAGLTSFGIGLVPDFKIAEDGDYEDGHEDFSAHGCDCCKSRLAGSLWRFALLGEGQEAAE